MNLTRDQIAGLLESCENGIARITREDLVSLLALAERALEPQGQALPELPEPITTKAAFDYQSGVSGSRYQEGIAVVDGVKCYSAEQMHAYARAYASQLALPAGPAPESQHSDDIAVDRFAAAMKEKLALAREKGRGGWEHCPQAALSRMLREHVNKGDPRDVANFCMMLWNNGAGIAAVPPWVSPAVAQPVADEREMTSRHYRKKPVVIQAVQWTGDNLYEVIAFTDGPPDIRSMHASMKWDEYRDLVARDGLMIFTLEGKMLANVGDWVIKGVKGEHYPCKPDIFAATYEPARAALCQPAEEGDKA